MGYRADRVRPRGGPFGGWRRARGALLGLLAILAAIVGAGMAYEAGASRGDAQRYPPTGRLVEVDGRALHLYCTGQGAPTVVLEAGLGEQSSTWASVQREVARSTRVCSYDRAGYGWSQARAGAGNQWDAAEDLHSLLARAGEKGPYVLVGHSIGGNVVRLFADRYSKEVSGLVLVDPTDEEAVIGAGEWGARAQAVQGRIFGLLGRLGVIRLFGASLVGWAVGTQPPPEVTARATVIYGPKSQAATVQELEESVESARLTRVTRRPGAWGDLPVVVISAGGQTDAVLAHHATLAGLSTAGRHVVARGTGHYVHYERPRLVTGSVLEVVREASRESAGRSYAPRLSG